MISIEQAQETGFATSTKAELRAYAEKLGLDKIAPNANAAVIKTAVMNALGMIGSDDHAAMGPVTKRPVTSAGMGDIFPSYNLTPDGIWGGRRRRISLPRPEGTKIAQAEGFGWNGKHTFYVPYDEVIDVPEPIYNIIAQNRRVRPKQTRTDIGDGLTEISTGWEFDRVPLGDYGVDEVTADRAGSLIEWYQSRGSEWFGAKNLRQLTLISQKLGVPINKKVGGEGVPMVPMNEEEIRAALLEFCYGFADADCDANLAIAP